MVLREEEGKCSVGHALRLLVRKLPNKDPESLNIAWSPRSASNGEIGWGRRIVISNPRYPVYYLKAKFSLYHIPWENRTHHSAHTPYDILLSLLQLLHPTVKSQLKFDAPIYQNPYHFIPIPNKRRGSPSNFPNSSYLPQKGQKKTPQPNMQLLGNFSRKWLSQLSPNLSLSPFCLLSGIFILSTSDSPENIWWRCCDTTFLSLTCCLIGTGRSCFFLCNFMARKKVFRSPFFHRQLPLGMVMLS